MKSQTFNMPANPVQADRIIDGAVRKLVSAERLRELLDYDEETGHFTRRVSIGSCCAGAKAGSLALNGYLRIRVDGRFYYCHRLAWLFVHGVWPVGVVDHLNGNRADNRIANLRDTTHSKNGLNSNSVNSASGFRGVYINGGKYQAKITVNGVQKSLGYFTCPLEASRAYEDFKSREAFR